MRSVIGYIFIVVALFIIGFVLYRNSKYSQHVPTFSPYTLLASSWEKYRGQFINTDGRVVDPSQGDITTSEGQSYALLRAVWIDDQTSFDKLWQWTRTNLQRPHDHLFGWKWGKRKNNTYGFIGGGGDNSASDADTDIALALLLASSRWGNKTYKTQALPIISDLWTTDTATVSAGPRYLVAGNWAATSSGMIINPSYFAPYAWRIFAKVDTSHDWNSLINPAYELLDETSQLPINGNYAIGLPPDWIYLDGQTQQIRAPQITSLTTRYSYDAMRIPWRIDVDYRWNHSLQAGQYLHELCSTLMSLYHNDGKLHAVYSHDGEAMNDTESPASYGALSGCFDVSTPTFSDTIYEKKIVSLYSNDLSEFNSKLSYYDQNWLWFGVALRNNFVINFYQ